ncbi:hypothetical protein [Steroidobacter denitrificans]|nr:hypothetical protein [Steroidobacter denitrificans]
MSENKFRSWSLADWPDDVYPNDSLRARRVLRVYRKELMSCGAVSRVGRELVVFADPYIRWVKSKAERVQNFKVAANEARKATVDEPAA